MDFLRRLHPGHADSPAAARLERAPRWATVGRQAATAPWSAPAADDPMHAAPDGARVTPPAMPRPVAIEPEPARPAASATVVIAAPSRLQATRLPTPDPRASGNLSSPAVLPEAERPGPPAVVPTRPANATAAVPGPPKPIASVRPAPSVAAPLRPQALQQAQRAAKPDAAPVVQVTIDRIDVRVPAASGAPAPGRKARPASAVAPLADYLRGKTHNGAAR